MGIRLKRSLDSRGREKTPQEVAGRILWDISSGEEGYTGCTVRSGALQWENNNKKKKRSGALEPHGQV